MLISVPELPVMITVAAPRVAELLAASVSVLVPVVLAGLNDAVTPFGRADAVRLTLPLKPSSGATVRVLTAPLAGDRESVDSDAESVNPGAAAAPVRSSIKGCPAGVPQPVARS